MFRKLSIVLAAVLATAAAHSATLTFSAQQTSGNSSVVPVLTWSTSPAADECIASGDPTWTGTKAVSGTATLASINQSKTYILTCSWAADTFAVLDWTVPTTNSDGTSYTDPNGYNIHYGTSSGSLTQSMRILNSATHTATINNLSSGQWFFCVGTVNLSNIEGVCSNVASKSLVPISIEKTVTITVTPAPMPGVLTVH